MFRFGIYALITFAVRKVRLVVDGLCFEFSVECFTSAAGTNIPSHRTAEPAFLSTSRFKARPLQTRSLYIAYRRYLACVCPACTSQGDIIHIIHGRVRGFVSRSNYDTNQYRLCWQYQQREKKPKRERNRRLFRHFLQVRLGQEKFFHETEQCCKRILPCELGCGIR